MCVINVSQSAIVHSYDDMCGSNIKTHKCLNRMVFARLLTWSMYWKHEYGFIQTVNACVVNVS